MPTLLPGDGEMAYRVICVALLASAVSGCGTAANLAGPDCGRGTVTPFGGVQYDRDGVQGAGRSSAAAPGPRAWGAGCPPTLYALDLPFSFVGDVLTLPYTRAYTRLQASVAFPPAITFAAPAAPAATPRVLVPVPPPTTPPAGPPVPPPSAPEPLP